MSYVVVDIGSSYTKSGVVTVGKLGRTQKTATSDFKTLVNLINSLIDKRITKIVIALPGIIDSEKGIVKECYSLPWLKGKITEQLLNKLNVSIPIRLVNDGLAHAYSFVNDNTKKGLISLTIGSAVAMSVFDVNGEDAKNLHGESWEINQHRIFDSMTSSERIVGYTLTNNNLQALLNQYGDKGYDIFGAYLGEFIASLIRIFAPRTIGISGGTAVYNWTKIEKSVREKVSRVLAYHIPNILVSSDDNSALRGLIVMEKYEKI